MYTLRVKSMSAGVLRMGDDRELEVEVVMENEEVEGKRECGVWWEKGGR